MEKVNPDNILSEEEKKACKESFDAYDKLGYGTLEVEELQKVLEGEMNNNDFKQIECLKTDYLK